MSDFEDMFNSIDNMYKWLTKRMFKDIQDIENSMQSGKLQGKWDIKPIDEPTVKGFIAHGHFQLGKQQPWIFPRHIKDEVREPLTDVFEEKGQMKLYVELPGVEKNQIQLNVTDGRAEVKAQNFYARIDLPAKDIDIHKTTAHFKNGVLEVTIPKKKKEAKENLKHTIKIE